MCKFLKRHWYLWTALSIVLVFLALSFSFIPVDMLDSVSDEGQWIENVSVVFLLQAVMFGIYAAYKTKNRGWYLYAYLAFAAAFRELDMHRFFTSDSILKLRFYLTPEFPLWEKVFGILFILSLIISVFLLIKKFIPSLKSLWHGVLHIQAFYVCLGLYMVAKCLDAFVRLFPFWSHWRDGYGEYMRYAEESMELFGALSLFLAVQFVLLGVSKHYKSQ